MYLTYLYFVFHKNSFGRILSKYHCMNFMFTNWMFTNFVLTKYVCILCSRIETFTKCSQILCSRNMHAFCVHEICMNFIKFLHISWHKIHAYFVNTKFLHISWTFQFVNTKFLHISWPFQFVNIKFLHISWTFHFVNTKFLHISWTFQFVNIKFLHISWTFQFVKNKITNVIWKFSLSLGLWNFVEMFFFCCCSLPKCPSINSIFSNTTITKIIIIFTILLNFI